MAQTRGRRTLAYKHGGGVVREIDHKGIASALAHHELPQGDDVVTQMTTFLCDRLVSVDAAPSVSRGSEKEIERIEKAASELMAAMRAYSDMRELTLSIKGDLFSIAGHMESDEYLYHWLICMSKARERYFEEYNPTYRYHRAIVRLHGLIRDAGGNVAIHRTSRFVRFLSALDEMRPGMIFPPETVNSGRVRYIERALETDSPNNDVKRA